MKNFRKAAYEPMPFVAPAGGVVSGVPVLVGTLTVVPQVTAAAGKSFAGLIEGVFVLPKATGTAYAVGAKAFFDFTVDKQIESTGTLIGIHVAPALTGDTTARVLIDFATAGLP